MLDRLGSYHIPYVGKTTLCHTYAFLSSLPSPNIMPDKWLFEGLTTVPFGIVHIPEDPNRLIDSYIDPDLGLDRALYSLDIPYEIYFWPRGTDGSEAIRCLKQWCKKEPVIIGPINMDGLPYYFHRELYAHIDHYIVISGMYGEKFMAIDSEGFPLVLLSTESLLDAWRGDRIPEGRGEFVLRRIEGEVKPKIDENIFIRTLNLAALNMEVAQCDEYGGGNGLRRLARYAINHKINSTLKRGLTYAIPTRIQRCITIVKFLHKAFHELKIEPPANGDWEQAIAILYSQIKLYSRTLDELVEGDINALNRFDHIASFEDDLTIMLKRISDSL